jgi:hypothetical protein
MLLGGRHTAWEHIVSVLILQIYVSEQACAALYTALPNSARLSTVDKHANKDTMQAWQPLPSVVQLCLEKTRRQCWLPVRDDADVPREMRRQ